MFSALASIRLSRAITAAVPVTAALLLVASVGSVASAGQGTPRGSEARAAVTTLSAVAGQVSPERKCAPVCAVALL